MIQARNPPALQSAFGHLLKPSDQEVEGLLETDRQLRSKLMPDAQRGVDFPRQAGPMGQCISCGSTFHQGTVMNCRRWVHLRSASSSVRDGRCSQSSSSGTASGSRISCI